MATEPKRDEKPKFNFGAEAEEKFAQFLKKVAEAKRKRWELSMKKEIEEVAKVTGVGEEGRTALEAAAKASVEQCLEGWSAKFDEYFRKAYSRQPEQAAEMFDQMIPQAESYANAYYLGEHMEPTEHTLWTVGLQRTLMPAQNTVWEKATAERMQAFEKSIGEFVKAQLERTREQLRTAILAKCADLKLTLTLSKERAEEFEKLAKEAADSAADSMRERMKRTLFLMDEEQRRQTMKGGNLYLPTDEKDLPHKQARWKEGIARLLSADEQKQLEASRAERRSRRVHAVGRMMVAEMDQHVAFTAAQRERLQPIAEQLIQQQAALFPEEGGEEYFNTSPQVLIMAGAKATEEQLLPILDGLQCQRWREAGIAMARRPKPRAKVPTDPTAKPPRRQPDPEEVEHGISDFLYEKSLIEAKRIRAVMSLKAEDAARVAGLSVDVVSRLQTAARGAAEESLAIWKTNSEPNVRAQVGDATPQNVKQRLASLENYYFQRWSSGTIGEKIAVWDNALKSELTEPQHATWQKEVDERNGYREKAMAAVIMAEFDRRNLLARAQWEKLESIIAGFIKEYRADIEKMFSPGNSTPWYMQYYSMFIPFAGIPENDLKAILSKEQWERWTGSNEFGNTSSYWENIQQMAGRKAKKAKE